MPDADARKRFLDAMSRVAASVHVLASNGPAGWAGLTVTALTSVSTEGPFPTLLACVNASAASAPVIEQNGMFCVNTLRDEHSYIADAFAGRFRTSERDKFTTGDWGSAPSGCPRLVDALVSFDCTIQSVEPIGSHLIFLAEVKSVHAGRDGAGLIYVNRGYHAPTRLDSPRDVTPMPAKPAAGGGGWLRRTLLSGGRQAAV